MSDVRIQSRPPLFMLLPFLLLSGAYAGLVGHSLIQVLLLSWPALGASSYGALLAPCVYGFLVCQPFALVLFLRLARKPRLPQ